MGHLEWLYKLNLRRRHQHCTDEAQKAETVLSAVSYIVYVIESAAYGVLFTNERVRVFDTNNE